MVARMPKLLTVISVVGTAAMLWVGGHIILVGVDELGWHWPYELVHHWEEDVEHAVTGIGSAVAWLVNTAASLVVGVVWGAIVVTVLHVLPFGPGHGKAQGEKSDEAGGPPVTDHGSCPVSEMCAKAVVQVRAWQGAVATPYLLVQRVTATPPGACLGRGVGLRILLTGHKG